MSNNPTPSPGPLADPDYAAFAWRRFRRIMAWMTLAAAVSVVAVLYVLQLQLGPLPLFMVLAVSGGVGFTVLMAAGLMGLVFLSSGTGHDEDVDAFNTAITGPGPDHD